MSLNLANVELSDSFNTWRLRTNGIISRSLQGTGTALSTANTQFNAAVTTNNLLNVNNNIRFLRSVSVNGTTTVTVRPTLAFSNTATFSGNTSFSAGIVTNYLRSTGDIHTTDIFGTSLAITGAISAGSLTSSGAISAGSLTSSGAISAGSLTTSGAISAGSLTSSGAVSAASLTSSGSITGSNLVLSGSITGVTSLTIDDLTVSNLILTANNLTVGNITANTVTATDFNSTSDARYKKNILNIEDPINLVTQLQGVRFDWKGSGKPSMGLIAQDVEKILPEIVSTDDKGIKYINYGLLTALLVEAIKQQQTLINNLSKSN